MGPQYKRSNHFKRISENFITEFRGPSLQNRIKLSSQSSLPELITLLTVSFGTSKILASSVTVPTMTAMQFSRPGFFMNLVIRAKEIGGRWILLMNNLFRIMLLNLELVLLAKNLYSCEETHCNVTPFHLCHHAHSIHSTVC